MFECFEWCLCNIVYVSICDSIKFVFFFIAAMQNCIKDYDEIVVQCCHAIRLHSF